VRHRHTALRQFRIVVAILLLGSLSTFAGAASSFAAAAQLPIPGVTTPAAPVAPPAPVDARGRTTPQSAVLNFLKYAQRGDNETAAKYFQLPPKKQSQDYEEYVPQLLVLINSSFHGSIATISDKPIGYLEDKDNPNQEIAGRFVVDDQDVPFLLVRETRADTGPIWLISQETLKQVPGLYQGVGSPRLGKYFPGPLMKHSFLGVPIAQWLAWLLTIPLSLFVGSTLVKIIQRIWALRKQTTGRRLLAVSRKPSIVLLASICNIGLVYFIGLPLFYRSYYFRLVAIVITVSFAWISAQVSDQIYRYSELTKLRRDSRSLIQLAHRLYKAAIVVAAILIIITIFGFNTNSMLAGLGIGGLALALAAQKSLEGLLSGIFLVMDKTASTGDECMISGRYVTVQEIGLRTTRTITREGTEIAFPNSMLTQNFIENYSRRTRFLLASQLSLSYECSLAQLQCAIAAIREILYAHARIDQATASIRLAAISPGGYRLDLSAYVNTAVATEFNAIQEDVMLRIVEAVESSGAVWAVPSQVTYLAKEMAIDVTKIAASEETVKKWQAEKQVPFPDFSPEHIAEIRGTLSYPSSDSAIHEKQRES
jgi:MscS family membrane protein